MERIKSQYSELWYDVEAAAIKAIDGQTIVELQRGLKFIYEPSFLFIQLPSGRKLTYPKPKLRPHEKFKDKIRITYASMASNYIWIETDTYGGKLVENIIQATARDCLRDAMLKLDRAGYKIAFHVHDEVVLDVPISKGSVEEVTEIMSEPLTWAPDFRSGLKVLSVIITGKIR